MSNINNNLFLKNTGNKNFTKFSLSWLLLIGEHFCTLSRSQAVNVARVDRSTFERWENGKTQAPLATLELLRPHAFGNPPSGLSDDWNGWRFQHGKLINNDFDYAFTHQDLKAVIYWQPLANKLGCENSSLKNRLIALNNAA